MAEVLGSAGAAIAVTSLAAKFYETIDNLIHNLKTAPDRLAVLRIQLVAFNSGLRRLEHSIRTGTLPTSQVQELNSAIHGGEIIIQQLYQHLSPYHVKEVRQANGLVVRTSPAWDRIQAQLGRGRIAEWSEALDKHCGTLKFLLEAKAFDRMIAKELVQEDLDGSASNLDSDLRIPTQLDQDEKDAWTILGQNFEPDEALITKESDATQKKPSGLGYFFKRNVSRIQEKAKDSRKELLEQYRHMLTTQREPQKFQLRVVMLGRIEAGKTQLAANVFGVPYLGNDFNAGRTAPENIRKQVDDPYLKRTGLALHDSGGIEGKKTKQFVRDYILYMQKQQCLEDRVHAIWYVIDCHDHKRAIQETDEEFLAGEIFDAGEIPIFIVFSKYDMLVDSVRETFGQGVPEDTVRKQALYLFQRDIFSKVDELIKDKSKFSFCRTGIYKDGTEYLPPNDGGPPFGVEHFVRQVENKLNNGMLQIQWVAMQQKDDQSKLYDSISRSIAFLWTARFWTKIAYLPLISMFNLAFVWNSILNIAGDYWKIEDWRESLSHQVLRAIFDVTGPGLLLRETGLSLNFSGAASLKPISKIALKMIVGVNLIGRQIFLQARNGTLTRKQIEAEILLFQKSDDRKRMAEVITLKRMGAIDYSKADRVDQVIAVAKEALVLSVGYVDDSFFTKERLRVIKEMSTIGQAH